MKNKFILLLLSLIAANICLAQEAGHSPLYYEVYEKSLKKYQNEYNQKKKMGLLPPEDNSGVVVGAGPAFSKFSTKLNGEKNSFNLFGGQLNVGYLIEDHEVGLNVGGFTGSQKKVLLASNVDLIYAPIKAYYHYNLNLNKTFSIYGGVSAGAAFTSVDASIYSPFTKATIKGSDNTVSWMAGIDAGVKINLDKNWQVAAGYEGNYIGNSSYDPTFNFMNNTATLHVESKNTIVHTASIKLVYKF